MDKELQEELSQDSIGQTNKHRQQASRLTNRFKAHLCQTALFRARVQKLMISDHNSQKIMKYLNAC